MRLKVFSLLLLVAVVYADTDTSSDVSSDSDASSDAPDTFTFLKPGISYQEYHVTWPEVHDIQLEFTFKTYTTNTMLLQHTFLEVEGGYRPELKVLLNKGILQVEHVYGDVVERLPVAKGMSHDRWHKVKVTLSVDRKKLSAQVGERLERSKGLKALVDPSSIQAYQGGPRTSVVFIGGFSPESLQQPSAFVGCVKDVVFSDGENVVSSIIHGQEEVENGCLSACNHDDPCQHGGSCVNLYTSTECDCYQTGYHGDKCDKQGLTTITLAGDDWIRYNLYEDVESERSHMPGIRIAMDFRTSLSEGVLFYASETQPQYNHIAVSLYNGTLHVSVVFEDRETHSELYTTIGKDLNDGRWHSLLVIHEGTEVRIHLDNESGEMEAKHSHPHLNMPEMIYFAGIEEGYSGIGLRSQQALTGCIRSLYFNHIAILDHLEDRAFYHGNSPLEYKCQDVNTTSLQYQHDGSYVRILSHDHKKLEVELELRTYKPDMLIFHTDMGTYDYKGYIKGYLVGAKFELHIVPSGYHGDERQTLTLGYKLNDAEWHTVKVYYNSGMVQLWVDDKFMIQPVQWDLTVGKATYFGYAPDIFDEKKSYIGCMRHLVVQGENVDPLPLVKSENSVGVSVGSCDLTDWCAKNPCLHGGLCVSEWVTSYCDCSRTYHEGSRCQFSTLRSSCQDYYLAGDRKSGGHLIDIDGDGPMKPVHVYCEFGAIVNGKKYGMTQVEHNLKPQTRFRGQNMKDMRKELQYREMSKSVMTSLVKSSFYCRQHLSLNCLRAILGLKKETWFTSAVNHTFSHVGGGHDGACLCNVDDSCDDKRYKCNCDQKSVQWVSDEAYLDKKNEVPITELTFLQTFGGQANVTLGPLECVGKQSQSDDHVVMFTTYSSNLDMEGWKGGSIEFIFRTIEAPAILLYQHGQDSSNSNIQLSIELVSDNKIVIKTSLPPAEIELITTGKLTSGDWQLLQMEIGNNQLRASIAGQKILVDLPQGVEGPGIYSTRLYVGDKPMKQADDFPGMIGCIGGLTYNGKTHRLANLVKTKVGLYRGCTTQCESDPCMNDSDCIEQWDSYQCICSNKYAHSGDMCEHNVNTNSVKFINSGLHLDFLETDLDILGNYYYISFRTNHENALLLYMYDHNNNFIQLDIEDGETFHLSYNSGYEIIHATVKVTGLTDGRWKQAAVFSEHGLLRLDVEGVVRDYKDERMPLLTYSQVPYKTGETIVPVRNLNPPAAGTRIYVGGVPESFIRLEGFKGCIRGLKIGDLLVDLAAAGEEKAGFMPGCPSGCETDPCENGGRCLDDVHFNGAFTCDCSGTQFAGELCDGEVGVYFKGDATMEESLHTLDNGQDKMGGQEARLELAFATSVQNIQNAAIGFVRGRTGLSDFMLLYLTMVDEQTCVAAKVQVQDKTVSLVGDQDTADGSPHRVVLERQGSKVTLQVDGSSQEAELDSVSESYDPVAILDVGWVRKDNFRFSEYVNFTGDIWNVFLTSDMLGVVNARPLEVYNGYDDGNHGITTVGKIAPVTQSLDGLAYGYMYGDTVWAKETEGSYPPWNPGVARTVQISSEGEDASQAGASPAIAFIVCGLALIFFLGMTLFLVLRHRNRPSASFSNNILDHTDEEEGLLRKINPHIESLEDDEPIATAKLRQGPKKGKAGSGVEEEENEETPMLQSEAPMAETGLGENIPMETFDKQIREMSPVEEITGLDDLEVVPPVPAKYLETSVDQEPMTIEVAPQLESSVPVVPSDVSDTHTPAPGPPKPPRISITETPQEPMESTPESPTEQTSVETSVETPEKTSPETPEETSSEVKVEASEPEEVPVDTSAVDNIPQNSETSAEDNLPQVKDPKPQENTTPDEEQRTEESSQSDPQTEIKDAETITMATATPDDESSEEGTKDIEITAEVYKEPSKGQSETGSNDNSGESSPVTVNDASFDDKITEIGDAKVSEKTVSKKGRNKRKPKH